MNKTAKIVLAACMLTALFAESGCVYYPAHPYREGVWVPAHWEGDVWIRGHYR